MRIEKLELKNFRSHQRSDFAFDRINVIRGHHGVGKSSIAFGIEFLLTGACAVTDAAGRGADALLMHGADEFGVRGSLSLTAEKPGSGAVILRQRNKAGGTLMVTTKKKPLVARQAESWMEEHLGPKPVLAAVLNAQRFLSMGETDRKKLLTMALAAEPVKLPDEIVSDLKQIDFDISVFVAGLFEVQDAGHCESIYKKLYERRREINSTLRDMGELDEPEKPAGMPSADDTRKKLNAMREELQTLTTRRTNMFSVQANDRRALEQAEADKKEFEPQLLESEEMEKLAKIAGKKDAAAMLDTQILRKKLEIEGIERELKQFRVAPENCHACGRPMPKQDSSELINNAEHRKEIAERELGELQKKREPLGDPEEADRKLYFHRRAVPRVIAADKTIKDIKPKLQSSGEPDTSEIDAEIAVLRQRVDKGEAVLTQVNQFEGQIKAFEQQKKQRAGIEAKKAIAERLVDYFGPDGELRTQLVGDKLQTFAGRMNEVLARFGFGCELSLEPFSVRVQYLRDGRPESGWSPLFLHQLSESEAFRFGVAFQISLAEATRVNLVVIDRADILLPGVQKFLNQALMESKLDQAFILAAKEDLTVKSLPPGVRLFDLGKDDDGRTAIIAVHGAESKELEYAPE